MAPRHFKVFLSSPGDVTEERAVATKILEHLPKDPVLKGKITIAVESWDDPAAPVPMYAGLTPQQAVDRGLSMPSACDFTVAILWGRMGTPLAEPRKPDGTQYVSGTEYEIEDARTAGRDVLLYRRTAKVLIDADDSEFEEKRRQKQLARWRTVDVTRGNAHLHADVRFPVVAPAVRRRTTGRGDRVSNRRRRSAASRSDNPAP